MFMPQLIENRAPQVPPLSARELQALELIARGFSYSEISRLQEVSVNTTRTHIRSIYTKLNVHSKNEAVFEATVIGLLRPLARSCAALPPDPPEPSGVLHEQLPRCAACAAALLKTPPRLRVA